MPGDPGAVESGGLGASARRSTRFNHRHIGAQFDRTIDTIERRLARETEANLHRGMHYPVRWDPHFTDFITLEDIYRYPTLHFDHHAKQLTLGEAV